MKIIDKMEFEQRLYDMIIHSASYSEGIMTHYDAERFAKELRKWLVKKNYYIKND